MIITVSDVMLWKPCKEYTRERVQSIIGNGKTPREILDLPIWPEDKLWVVLREEVISTRYLRHFAYDCAERARRTGVAIAAYGAAQAVFEGRAYMASLHTVVAVQIKAKEEGINAQKEKLAEYDRQIKLVRSYL